jgi:hypothetical protein
MALGNLLGGNFGSVLNAIGERMQMADPVYAQALSQRKEAERQRNSLAQLGQVLSGQANVPALHRQTIFPKSEKRSPSDQGPPVAPGTMAHISTQQKISALARIGTPEAINAMLELRKPQSQDSLSGRYKVVGNALIDLQNPASPVYTGMPDDEFSRFQAMSPEMREEYLGFAQAKRPSTSISLNLEDKTDKALLDVDADILKQNIQATAKLKAIVPEMHIVKNLAESGELKTGLAGVGGAKIAGALGIDAKGLGATQLVTAIQNKLGPAMRTEGSGSSSDRDVGIFMNSLPNIMQTPDGIKKTAEYIIRTADRRAEEEKIARRIFKRDGNLSAFYDETAKLPPLFAQKELAEMTATQPKTERIRLVP